jgi:hypothetical protein
LLIKHCSSCGWHLPHERRCWSRWGNWCINKTVSVIYKEATDNWSCRRGIWHWLLMTTPCRNWHRILYKMRWRQSAYCPVCKRPTFDTISWSDASDIRLSVLAAARCVFMMGLTHWWRNDLICRDLGRQSLLDAVTVIIFLSKNLSCQVQPQWMTSSWQSISTLIQM